MGAIPTSATTRSLFVRVRPLLLFIFVTNITLLTSLRLKRELLTLTLVLRSSPRLTCPEDWRFQFWSIFSLMRGCRAHVSVPRSDAAGLSMPLRRAIRLCMIVSKLDVSWPFQILEELKVSLRFHQVTRQRFTD